MYPILCRIGPFTLFSYGFMLLVAYAAGVGLARRRISRWQGDPLPLDATGVADLAAVGLLGGIAGGRIFFVAQNWEWMRHDPFEILAIWHGGLVWYGGLAGGVLAGWVALARRGVRFISAADQLAPLIALGHGLGRIGCFLNGCCYGVPTDAWFGLHFPGQPGAVVPTQLFESAGLFVLAAVLWGVQRPSSMRRPGWVFGAYALGYGLLRFAIEFLRGDPRLSLGGLSLQQWISIALALTGIVLLARARRAGG